jgi:hypothetical protein
MKQKILFYGNCQVGAIARFFRLNLTEQFEVQLCTECGLAPFWNEPGLFAVWSPLNKEKQQEYVKQLHSKIRESDIFVFQNHEGNHWLMNELTTKYLHDTVATGIKICIPDSRLFIYLSDNVAIKPYIEYVKTKVSSKEEAINYLKNSEDLNLSALLKNEYPFNLEFKRYRNENRERHKENLKAYDNVINMCDFMEAECKTKQIALTHNHMSESYYFDLIKKLYNILNTNDSNLAFENFEYPGQGASIINPKQFKFFNNIFPTISLHENANYREITVNDIP